MWVFGVRHVHTCGPGRVLAWKGRVTAGADSEFGACEITAEDSSPEMKGRSKKTTANVDGSERLTGRSMSETICLTGG